MRLQRMVGNRGVRQLVGAMRPQTGQPSVAVAQRQQQPVEHVPWTGDPVTMANALRDLLPSGQIGRIVRSLSMLWIRGIVDTLRMLKLDAASFQRITSAPEFARDARLTASLAVVEGRSASPDGLPRDQAIELKAMEDVPRWPTIIGPTAALPNSDSPDTMRGDPRYLAALYDAIKRNRAMATYHLLEKVGKGHRYVGPSHKDDQPGDLGKGDEARQKVNQAIWKELGVGEGTQASINTYDSAKFSFGPGFAARGGLDVVMKNLAKRGASVLGPLRDAGVVFQDNTWYVVDPDSHRVRSGKDALDILSKDVGLINVFLETAADPAMRRQWMDAEWQAMSGRGGAAAVPDQVVNAWPVDLIVFVAHCVHWRPKLDWNYWNSPTPPSVFRVVRDMAPLVDRQADDPRILTRGSARTFLGFSGGLLVAKLRAEGQWRGIAAPLPDDWKTGFAGAIALPESDTTPRFHVITADDK